MFLSVFSASAGFDERRARRTLRDALMFGNSDRDSTEEWVPVESGDESSNSSDSSINMLEAHQSDGDDDDEDNMMWVTDSDDN